MYISTIDYLSKTKLGHFWIVQGKCYSNMNFIYILKLATAAAAEAAAISSSNGELLL